MLRRRLHRGMRLTVGAVVSAGVLVFASPAFASHGPDVNGAAKFGLCRAYFKGSKTGTSHKHKHSTAFKKLEAAAAAHSETVEAFCTNAKPGSPTAAANRHGPPTSSPNHSSVNGQGTPPTSVGGTSVADGNSHDGASLKGTTTADAASDGHSAKGSNNAGTHRP